MNLTNKNLFTNQFFIFSISKMFQIFKSITVKNYTVEWKTSTIFPTPEFWFITHHFNVRQKCDANLSKERVISIHVYYYYYCEPISLLIIFFSCCTKWNNNLQFEIFSIPCSLTPRPFLLFHITLNVYYYSEKEPILFFDYFFFVFCTKLNTTCEFKIRYLSVSFFSRSLFIFFHCTKFRIQSSC